MYRNCFALTFVVFWSLIQQSTILAAASWQYEGARTSKLAAASWQSESASIQPANDEAGDVADYKDSGEAGYVAGNVVGSVAGGEVGGEAGSVAGGEVGNEFGGEAGSVASGEASYVAVDLFRRLHRSGLSHRAGLPSLETLAIAAESLYQCGEDGHSLKWRIVDYTKLDRSVYLAPVAFGVNGMNLRKYLKELVFSAEGRYSPHLSLSWQERLASAFIEMLFKQDYEAFHYFEVSGFHWQGSLERDVDNARRALGIMHGDRILIIASVASKWQ